MLSSTVHVRWCMTFPNVLWRHKSQLAPCRASSEDKYLARLALGLAVNLFVPSCVLGSLLRPSLGFPFCTAIVLIPTALETICVRLLLWPLRLARRRRLLTRTNGISRRSRMDGTFEKLVIVLSVTVVFADAQFDITRGKRRNRGSDLDLEGEVVQLVVLLACLEALLC